MKTTMTMLKAGLVGLFFMVCSTFVVYAQDYPLQITTPITTPEDLDVGAKPAEGNTVPDGATVLFYNPTTGGPTFTMAPSLTDDNDITFDFFRWSKVVDNGLATEGEVDILASDGGGRYVIGPGGNEEALSPGYHVFRVLGFVGETDGASICESTEWQDYVVYVLPPLSVTAGLAPESSAIIEYCETDIPDGEDAIILSNTALNFKTTAESGESGIYKDVNDDFTSPSTGDFEYNYQWYSIKLNEDGSEGARTAITGATVDEYEVNLAPGQDGYDGPGTYVFEVEIEYAIKGKEDRTYVTYIGRAQNATGEDLEITITPQPGKPTITIENIED